MGEEKNVVEQKPSFKGIIIKSIFLIILAVAAVIAIWLHRFYTTLPSDIHLKNNISDMIFYYIYGVWGTITILGITILYKISKEATSGIRLLCLFVGGFFLIVFFGMFTVEGFGQSISKDEVLEVYDDGYAKVRWEDWNGSTWREYYTKEYGEFYMRDLTQEEMAEAIELHGELKASMF